MRFRAISNKLKKIGFASGGGIERFDACAGLQGSRSESFRSSVTINCLKCFEASLTGSDAQMCNDRVSQE